MNSFFAQPTLRARIRPLVPTANTVMVIVMVMVVTISSVLAPLAVSAQELPGGAGPLPLFVPVAEVPVLPVGVAEVLAGASTSFLAKKSTADQIATIALKAIIALARDMVIRWIVTGRFESPVFSTSFFLDSTNIAENASRIFLSRLTGVNFCAGFGIPSSPSLSLRASLGLACSLPPEFNNYDFFTKKELYSEIDRIVATRPENIYPFALVNTLEAKANDETNALVANAAEYFAGQGFLGIKDEKGRIKTPGSVVAAQVVETVIGGPARDAGVAATVQQAISAIVDTAVRVLIEKGLSEASGDR